MKKTQEERVLEYMKKYNGITDKEARDYLGINRLGARIYDLKKAGYNVVDEWKQGKNRYKEITRFKRYMLAEDKFIQDNEKHFS